MTPMFARRVLLSLPLLLAACATARPPAAPFLLRLSPASLGRSIALEQRLTATARGTTHRLDVLLEADTEAVRLAVVNLGQTAARLEWNGKELIESRASWWPAAVSGERILSDLQLMLWPAEAIRAALPAGWTLVEPAGERLLAAGGGPVARVRYLTDNISTLQNLREGYTITVDSRPLGAAP